MIIAELHLHGKWRRREAMLLERDPAVSIDNRARLLCRQHLQELPGSDAAGRNENRRKQWVLSERKECTATEVLDFFDRLLELLDALLRFALRDDGLDSWAAISAGGFFRSGCTSAWERQFPAQFAYLELDARDGALANCFGGSAEHQCGSNRIDRIHRKNQDQ